MGINVTLNIIMNQLFPSFCLKYQNHKKRKIKDKKIV